MDRCTVGIKSGELDRQPVGKITDNGKMMIREPDDEVMVERR